jgi:hypothetical protein
LVFGSEAGIDGAVGVVAAGAGAGADVAVGIAKEKPEVGAAVGGGLVGVVDSAGVENTNMD